MGKNEYDYLSETILVELLKLSSCHASDAWNRFGLVSVNIFNKLWNILIRVFMERSNDLKMEAM